MKLKKKNIRYTYIMYKLYKGRTFAKYLAIVVVIGTNFVFTATAEQQ